MARVTIPVLCMDERNKLGTVVPTAVLFRAIDASEGGDFEMNGRDDKTVIFVQNAATSDKMVTIKAGNGIQGVCDLVASIPASSTVPVVLDSGRFKNVSGEDKGKVVVMGESEDIKLAVVVLP